MTTTETTNPHAKGIMALRTLAAWLDEHPNVDGDISAYGSRAALLHPCLNADELRDAARRIGGTWKKETDAHSFRLVRDLGNGANIRLHAGRASVCERVVTGVETVEEPDPAAPTVTVQRDIVEWRCPEALLDGVAA